MNHLKKIFTRYFFHFPLICSFVLHLWLPNVLTLASRPNPGFNMGLGHFGHPVAPCGTLWHRCGVYDVDAANLRDHRA